MHILIVEDERALCETIVRSLRRLAYSVDFCHDGKQALRLLCVSVMISYCWILIFPERTV